MEERLYIILRDIERMREALRRFKLSKNLPPGDLDPVGEYIREKQQKEMEKSN